MKNIEKKAISLTKQEKFVRMFFTDLLLRSGKRDVNKKNDLGNTLLHDAIKYGNEKEVELLLNNGADINIKGEDNLTPLGLSKKLKNDKILGLLEKKKKESWKGKNNKKQPQ